MKAAAQHQKMWPAATDWLELASTLGQRFDHGQLWRRGQVNAMVIAQLDSNPGHASRCPAVAETLSATNAASAARTVA
jgi:hypothetical protein